MCECRGEGGSFYSFLPTPPSSVGLPPLTVHVAILVWGVGEPLKVGVRDDLAPGPLPRQPPRGRARTSLLLTPSPCDPSLEIQPWKIKLLSLPQGHHAVPPDGAPSLLPLLTLSLFY